MPIRKDFTRADSSAMSTTGPATDLLNSDWRYLCCSCFVKISSQRVEITYQCRCCGNTNLRFIHTLENVTDGIQIEVGIECATRLLNDCEIPRIAENEVKRKERWRREKYKTPGRCSVDVEELKRKGKL